MKKSLVLISIFLAVVFIAAGCSSSQTSKNEVAKPESKSAATTETKQSELKKVKIAYYGGTCEAPLYTAYEKGFFKEKGLDVELIKVTFDTLKEGIATGKIDAIQVSAGELKPIEQGLDIKITNGVHTGCIQTVVPNNSSIQSIKDLKGKTIGVEAMGGVPMTLLSIELSKNGIDPKTDVTWKVFPAPQLALVLEKGEIDAFGTWDPFGQLALNDQKVRRLFSNTHTEPYSNMYCCFIGLNGKLVKNDPATAKAITEAIQAGGVWVEKNPQEAAKLAIDKKYTGGDVTTSGELLHEYTFTSDTAKAKESLAFYFNGLKEQKILDPSTDPQLLLENTFVDLYK